MSDRDRQNQYDRGQQHGGYRGSEGYDSPRQANQWQSGDDHRQQGGDWQQDAGQRANDDSYTRDYRYSGQGGAQNRGGSRDYLPDQDYGSSRGEHRDSAQGYRGSRGGYGQNQGRDDDWQRGSSQGRYGQRGGLSGYAGRDYDASGGNDFGNFTSEDYGGRDFYNRNAGVSGGARSSESYRPSYGLSSWFGDDDDDRQSSSRNPNRGGQGRSGSNREDYGSWRQYGESRGFFARAGDEIASWFGDEEASRRRDRDHREDNQSSAQSQSQSQRGRGPSNYTRSDDRIREDANDHLTHDHYVDASHISVSVKDGELTLDGTVDSRDAKRRAEDAVEHISGVKHVQNNLRVQERSSASTSYSTSGGSGSSFGQNSGQSLGSSLTGSSSATGSTGSSTTGSSSTGQTGTSTTSGIGSAAAAGVGGASATRPSDKTS